MGDASFRLLLAYATGRCSLACFERCRARQGNGGQGKRPRRRRRDAD